MSAHKNQSIFSSLHSSNLRSSSANKINFLSNIEFNGKSFKIYRIQILILEVKIFMNIQLDVICADMVDFRRLSHILYYHHSNMKRRHGIYSKS